MATQPLKIIEWGDPPSSTRGPAANSELLAVLADVKDNARANPGKWAKIATNRKDSGLVTRINHGRVAGVEKGEFEAKSSSHQNGTGRVYDIWVRPIRRRGRPKGSKNGASKVTAAKKVAAKKVAASR